MVDIQSAMAQIRQGKKEDERRRRRRKKKKPQDENIMSASAMHPVFSASHGQHSSDLHSKFALRPTQHAWKYGRHPICDG